MMFGKADAVRSLPPRLHEVLKAIHEYTNEHGRPPYRNNRALFDRLPGRSGNEIANCKRKLIDQNYLTEELELASKGIEYSKLFFFRAFSVRGVDVQLQGEVHAGPGDLEVLANYEELERPSSNFITIPDVHTDRDIFALKVTGPSMEELGIFNGDYVIVERNDSWWPEPQQLIITRYLPFDPNRGSDDHVEDSDFVGPVLKVYFRRFGEHGAELGWKRHNEHNPYAIKADRLKPVGKVVGVYRDQQNLINRLPTYPLSTDSI